MAAKRKITIKKKVEEVEEVKNVEEEVKEETPVEETPVVEETETPVVEEETPVTTDVENEIMGTKSIKADKNVAWRVGSSVVTRPRGRIKFEAQVAPYPIFLLPQEIKRYLISHWLTSDVYKKDKKWLEKHNVDMEIVEKLKKFLTERL